MMKLKQDFFLQPTLYVARRMLGKLLVHEVDGRRLVGRIVETEAYNGPQDLASHASRGRKARTAVMFDVGGHWYVYMIYGMYYCLNVVTEQADYPAAVLIRAVEPVSGFGAEAKTNGPGKLCRAYGIDRALNASPAFGPESTLWMEDDGVQIAQADIVAVPRVGVDYAGAYRDMPWRFYIKGNIFVSKR